MNSQEVFDTVAKHLFAQGERSMDERAWGYAYRAVDGKKCAIGILIPDREYDPSMEDTAVRDILVDVPSLNGIPTHLLTALQQVHDFSGNWCADGAMKDSLAAIAKNFGLSPAVLDGLSFNRA